LISTLGQSEADDYPAFDGSASCTIDHAGDKHVTSRSLMEH